MDDEKPDPQAEPGAQALAIQDRSQKLQEWWAQREQEWAPQRQRLNELHARLAAQAEQRKAAKRAPRPKSEHLPRPEAVSGDDEVTKRSSEKHVRDSSSPDVADALHGWNPRKSPRPTSSGSAAQGNVPSNGIRESDRGTSRQQQAARIGPTTPSIKANHSMRDLSSIRAQKKPRESVSSSGSPQSPLTISEQRSPPEWYKELKFATKRRAAMGDAEVLCKRIKDKISMLKRMGPTSNNQKEMNELRTMLHEAPFLNMGQDGPQLLRNNRMLHNEDGLPQILDDDFATTMKGHWPWDVRSDAAELYHKWSAKIFDNDMLFGLILAQKGKYADDDRTADKVDKRYQVPSKYQGNGKLVNGQWWPTLLCALRDGAHGDSQAGISGEPGIGAYSCFMSGGNNHSYPDEDHGNIVDYFGQDTTIPGEISRGTKLLIKSKQNNIPVRFIRSSKAASRSKYAPELGFRYDGLYDVTSYELVDKSKERYKFKLVRQADQGPIRGGNGPEARPTKQEVERYTKDKRFRGY